MNKTLNIVLAVISILALCVVGTGVLGLGALAAYDHNVRLQSPVMVVAEESVAQAPTETNPAQVSPVVENAAQPAPMQECKAINDYQLKDLTEMSSQPNSLIHVEWYTADGQPEYESVLPSGRYTVDKPFPGGHVWEYSTSCSVEQVLNQVAGHIARRLQNQANNKGYRPWEDLVDLGFISQVTSTSSVVVPDVLP